MLADFVMRTPRPLQLLNSVRSLKSRLDGCRRAFFAIGLFVVALSIVGMHQLSLNHELAAVTSLGGSAVTAPNAGHPHNDAHDRMTSGRNPGPAAANPGTVAFSAQQASVTIDAPNGGSDGHQQDCPGCGSHTMAFGTCLLASTLLALSWWIAPPRVQLLPPKLLVRLVTVVAEVGRRVPALSLAELSILRT